MKLLMETLLTASALVLLAIGLKTKPNADERFAQLENVGTFGM